METFGVRIYYTLHRFILLYMYIYTYTFRPLEKSAINVHVSMMDQVSSICVYDWPEGECQWLYDELGKCQCVYDVSANDYMMD